MYSRSTLILAAAFFAGSVATAGATDVYHGEDVGSIKDNAIETILVPQAVEIPETAAWYLRADFGYSLATSTEINTTAPGATEPGEIESFGVGFGRYLSSNIRIDFTADYRKDDEVLDRAGTFVDTIFRPGVVTRAGPDGAPVDLDDIIQFNLRTQGIEQLSFQNHTLMTNLYYDFGSFGRFKPYVGAGVGLSIYNISTVRKGQFRDCDAFASDGVQLANCDLEQADLDAANEERESDQFAFGYAASATVGAALDITEDLSLDMNYRVTYSGANVVGIIGGLNGTVDVGSKTDHDLRIGVRYDLW